MRDLGTLGGTSATGEWLNDRGDVIGISDTTQPENPHAFVWRPNKLLDLGTVAGDNSSHAFGINNRGQVAGQSWNWDGQQVVASHAFVWLGSGPMLDLNTLVSGTTEVNLVEADFITDSGWIARRDRDGAGSDMTSSSVEEPAAALRNPAPLTSQMRAVLRNRIERTLRHRASPINTSASKTLKRRDFRYRSSHPIAHSVTPISRRCPISQICCRCIV